MKNVNVNINENWNGLKLNGYEYEYKIDDYIRLIDLRQGYIRLIHLIYWSNRI